MILKRTMAKTTKYATLVRRGLAVFKERMIVEVPVVMVNNLAHLNTLKALKMPMWCVPRSTPVVARANVIQKLTMAMKSILLQLCRRYGMFLAVFDLACSILILNGSARG
jgi:hypothetical protein